MSALLQDCRDNATGMGLCIVLVAALGRAGGSYKTPGLSSFRETSAFEYTADDAVLLSRHPDAPDDPEDPDEGDSDPSEASDLLVLLDHIKARRGRTYRRRLVFDRARQGFRRATRADGGPAAAPPPTPASIAAALAAIPPTSGGMPADPDPF